MAANLKYEFGMAPSGRRSHQVLRKSFNRVLCMGAYTIRRRDTRT